MTLRTRVAVAATAAIVLAVLLLVIAVPKLLARELRDSLDDVFMKHTGNTIRDAEEDSGAARNRRIMQVMAGGRR